MLSLVVIFQKSQRQLKVIKKEKKTVAEMATEQEIATVQEQREAIRDHDEHDDNSSTSNTSASSIAPVIPEVCTIMV